MNESTTLIIWPLVLGVLGFVLALKTIWNNPARAIATMGLLIFWLVIINFIFGNIYYDQIPEILGETSTGLEQFSRTRFNITFGLLSLLGFLFVLSEINTKFDKLFRPVDTGIEPTAQNEAGIKKGRKIIGSVFVIVGIAYLIIVAFTSQPQSLAIAFGASGLVFVIWGIILILKNRGSNKVD
ncbi:hypothetical protein KKG41_06635 [Patescibacteria group bacterium]|nr:hypothetical protein [Patescibacteria group bacterium]MBU1890667.1 hypothetical protein [Patescibacteria group bacterium]